jgi:hypothetical protein
MDADLRRPRHGGTVGTCRRSSSSPLIGNFYEIFVVETSISPTRTVGRTASPIFACQFLFGDIILLLKLKFIIYMFNLKHFLPWIFFSLNFLEYINFWLTDIFPCIWKFSVQVDFYCGLFFLLGVTGVGKEIWPGRHTYCYKFVAIIVLSVHKGT